jgi:ribosomal protein S18 acetylase RimI-like enzyme
LSPGSKVDEKALIAVNKATIPPERLETLGAINEEIDRYHPHDEPLWYLPCIGVDATAQGKGIGSALMKYALQFCDEQGTRAYLESSNPANISLYERYGFEVMGRIEVGSAPPISPMIRERR